MYTVKRGEPGATRKLSDIKDGELGVIVGGAFNGEHVMGLNFCNVRAVRLEDPGHGFQEDDDESGDYAFAPLQSGESLTLTVD